MANTKSAALKSDTTAGGQGDAPAAASAVEPVRIGGESLADRLAPHIKKIFVIGGVIAVLALVLATVRWRQNVGKEATTAAYVKALAVASRPIVSPETPAAGTEGFASRQLRAEAALAALGSTRVNTAESQLYVARLHFEARQFDKAQALFEGLARASGSVGLNAALGLGYVAEARAEDVANAAQKQTHLETALRQFEAAGAGRTEAAAADSLYHQGRILHQLGRAAEAQATLDKALASSPTPVTKALIDARLGLVASDLP
ncbi:MAG: hypothetical protein IPL79_04250 [Myxococcales bacterium]|nr:hypothetical protein [Myxococcales bacterium]